MSPFEQRLSAAVLALALAGCADDEGHDSSGDPETAPSLEALCRGEEGPDHHYVRKGYTTITPGETCPEVEDARLSQLRCNFDEWRHTCAFLRVERQQVYYYPGTGYGGNFYDADSRTSLDGDVVDVCWYEGVFESFGTCGRPMRHEGRAVVASVHHGSAWSTGPTPDADHLPDADRRLAGAFWLSCARLEHASVASFAVFALDLMRLGAPPDLLRGAHHAALDEVRHAERCFALARAYLGDHEPGPLPIPPVNARSTADIAEALVREGCIGETLAVFDAAARLRHATDPAVRAVLQQIVDDESRHAALAWRALAWMLARGDDAVATRVALVFEEESTRTSGRRSGVARPSGLGSPDAWRPARAHGWLHAAERSRALALGRERVIAPSWAALRRGERRRRPETSGAVRRARPATGYVG